jgi:hypothetical protein
LSVLRTFDKIELVLSVVESTTSAFIFFDSIKFKILLYTFKFDKFKSFEKLKLSSLQTNRPSFNSGKPNISFKSNDFSNSFILAPSSLIQNIFLPNLL